jgi:hypothetical protein
MVADKRWKLVHALGFRPMLYDLRADPNEFRDLGADPACEDERRRLMAALNAWGLRLSQRTARSEEEIRQSRGKSQRRGILIGVWTKATCRTSCGLSISASAMTGDHAGSGCLRIALP